MCIRDRNKEEHLSKLDFFTTLAGYVHWQLTGHKVLGVGDASGMFPIDSTTEMCIRDRHCSSAWGLPAAAPM